MYIDRKEVLRFLGCRGDIEEPQVDNMIDRCLDEIGEIAGLRYIYRVFAINRQPRGLHLEGTSLVLTGADISRHLAHSRKCALMAVTLGNRVENRIRYYSRVDLTRALVMDACATAAVEALCDRVEGEIREMARKQGYGITRRYSPGYGDLPLSLQPVILNVLDAQRRIGLTVTEDFILIPRKSVTAVIGFNKGSGQNYRYCDNCGKKDECIYRREGKFYG